MKIATSPEIISLANTLGYREGCPVASIRTHCLAKLRAMVNGRVIKDMDALEDAVCGELKLGVHRVWSDQELDELMKLYISHGHVVFASLKQQLSPDAYGIFIKLTHLNEQGQPWVCVIDCRGEKSHRRHWTLWHEVTHCLTFVDGMELPLRRTTIPVEQNVEKEPIEVLTDYIAKDLAFYSPMFDPVLSQELTRESGKLSFPLIERVRNQFSMEASFESTMNACIDRCSVPYMLLEVAPGYNKKERAAKEAGDDVKPSLRVVRTYCNEPASKIGVYIPKNYRVPKNSVITKAHSRPSLGMSYGFRNLEDLGNWTDSTGRSLRQCKIHTEAKKCGTRVFAIVELMAA